MQIYKLLHIAIFTIAVTFFFSCSDDLSDDHAGKEQVSISMEIQDSVEVLTRAASGYTDFNGTGYEGLKVGVFANCGIIDASGYVTYSSSTWESNVFLGPNSYKFYAYMPYSESAPSVSLDNHNTLKFSGMPAFPEYDFYVSAAANKNQSSLVNKSYEVVVQKSITNKVCFRMNHLLSQMQLNFKIGEKYSQVRQVEITKVVLSVDKGSYDIVYTPSTLGMNYTSSGSSASKELAYTGSGTSKLNSETKALLLTTTAQEYNSSSALVVPAALSNLNIAVTYNVFDKKGTVTRQGQTATNTIQLASPAAAKKYLFNITVEPTYLYQLSGADLDSPTLKVN